MFPFGHPEKVRKPLVKWVKRACFQSPTLTNLVAQTGTLEIRCKTLAFFKLR